MTALLMLALAAADPVDLFPESMTPTGELVRSSSTDPDGSVESIEGGFRVTSVAAPLKTPWMNQVIIRTTGDIQKGDVLLLTVPLGLTESPSGDGRVKISLTHEPAEGENKAGLKYDEIVFEGERKDYHTAIMAETDVPAGEGRLALHLSRQPQTFEVGRVRLRNYGPGYPLTDLPKNALSYQGRAADASWRAEAAARIETHRKAPITVDVVDEDGNPVADAYVHVRLKRLDFGLGSAIRYPLVGADEAEFPLSLWSDNTWSWEDAEQYRKIVAEQFNRVVFEAACRPNVWPSLHDPSSAAYPQQERPRQLQLMKAFGFLDEHNIELRGHYLSWGAIDHPPQTRFVGKPAEHWDYQTRIAKEHPIQLGRRVDEWDVLNHPCGWGITMEELHGGLDLHVETMRIARASAPEGTKLYMNEGHVLHERSQIGNYERIIKHLIAEDAGPDGIGFMGHFSDKTLTGMDDAYAIFERFAPLAKHLQITELDVSAAQDEQLHADYIRDLVTLAYSHPKMDGVVQWGFWEGAHWKPETALYRMDWSPKPAAEAWKTLVTETFHTYEQGRTDAEGRFTATGCHRGDYEVYATTDGYKSWQIVESATDGETIRAVLKPDEGK